MFGYCTGGFAEYACGNETSFVRKPNRITFEQAAGIPVAACTALMALRDHGQLQPKQTVLIGGAAGGIGTFAVGTGRAGGTGSNWDLLPLIAQVFKQPFTRLMRQRVVNFVSTTRRDDLKFLAELIESGKVTPVVDRIYALADTADAIRHVESGHARGKVIVSV